MAASMLALRLPKFIWRKIEMKRVLICVYGGRAEI